METKEVNGIVYEFREYGERKFATIVKAIPPENEKKEVVIPHDIDGYIVAGVKYNAFSSDKNKWIEIIRFNSPILFIDSGAFEYHLKNLRIVEFLAKQKTPYFDRLCFGECKNLEELHFANHEKIGAVCLFRDHRENYGNQEKRLIRSILAKSNNRAFYCCWKLPVSLEAK